MQKVDKTLKDDLGYIWKPPGDSNLYVGWEDWGFNDP